MIQTKDPVVVSPVEDTPQSAALMATATVQPISATQKQGRRMQTAMVHYYGIYTRPMPF